MRLKQELFRIPPEGAAAFTIRAKINIDEIPIGS
jgi:hypothetical protein